MLGDLFALIINLLPQILEGAGVISPTIENIILKLGASLPGLILSFIQGAGPTDEAMSVLAELKLAIGVLRDSGTLDPARLAKADSLQAALTKALNGYQFAQTTTDPSTLTDLPEDLTPTGNATP